MEILRTQAELDKTLNPWRNSGLDIGFVPTMGALHAGHIGLVKLSVRESGRSVVSIFVNPIQFNQKEDYEKYPVQHDRDFALLAEAGCHAVFVPSVQEMYPGPVEETYDFGTLERVMEGEFRPGHFKGVAVVVGRFFDLVKPRRAYFGEKDFQQLKIIQALVSLKAYPTEVIPCPTVREADGLAMSSRNQRLSSETRSQAAGIFRIMKHTAENITAVNYSVAESLALKMLNGIPGCKPEYFRIADEDTLLPPTLETPLHKLRIFTAVWLGGVRLIDNMKIIS